MENRFDEKLSNPREADLAISDNFMPEAEVEELCKKHNAFYTHKDGFYYIFSNPEIE